ncbi:HEAT repeat domain-containing protein [Paenibacillus turpanensis]|uniref:HEAT repeat domain-containing protein n=1 Tax=Paenibacillus turpanensis TaxID=2689078 RepID=UPI00140DB286|nr:HEAT repeat domain-containing protein [Paenibacillus turpanensis]
MEYKVYNENNVRVIVTDEQLINALHKPGTDLTVEVVVAMGASRNKQFSPKLEEALRHSNQKVRIESIYSLLNIGESGSIEKLKAMEKDIPESDYLNGLSEKAILNSVLIRFEKGASSLKQYFFEKDLNWKIKIGLLYNYSDHFLITEDDLYFIIDALDACIQKNENWLKNIGKDDWEDVVIKGLEAVWIASEQNSVLNMLTNQYFEKISIIGSKILKSKIDPYAKEVVAIFSKHLPTQYAYEMLEPIMNGRAKGDLKKELEKSLQILLQKER